VWSADGTKIAFDSLGNGGWDIWVMDANGANARDLTSSPAEDVVPTWSPDGRKIAFQTNRDGDREIYVMNADGSNPHDVSNRHLSQEEVPTGRRTARSSCSTASARWRGTTFSS
jgi:Tol biopolymer transport system component